MQFLVSKSVYELVAKDTQYAPSAAWRSWASGTFVGISGELLMIKSGHRFVESQEAMAYLSVVGAPRLFKTLKNACRKFVK